MDNFDYSNYSLFKVNEMITVEKDITDIIKESPEFSSIWFLEQFLSFVEQLSSGNILVGDMKRNILNYVNSVLDMEFDNDTKENKVKRIDLINKIIRTLNNQIKDKSIDFYRVEMYKRSNCKSYLNSFKIDDNEILAEKEALFASIKFERIILYTHSNEVSDQDFVDKYLFEIVDNNMYYAAINCMLMECPEVFLDKIFYDRFLTVMDINLTVSKNKFIKRSIKSFKKTIVKTRKKLGKK